MSFSPKAIAKQINDFYATLDKTIPREDRASLTLEFIKNKTALQMDDNDREAQLQQPVATKPMSEEVGSKVPPGQTGPR